MSTGDSRRDDGRGPDGDQDVAVGEVLGNRYRVEERLGEGGLGSVYRALDQATQTVVAVKVLHRETAGVEELSRRFEREAFATSRISHPNCVMILDFGTLSDGRMFLVVEHLDGVPLSQVLGEGPIELERSLRIMGEVARGLEAAHSAGIVHRDLKPANVFLVGGAGEGEQVKVLDFGLAKLIGEAGVGQEKLTRAGFAMGTPKYLAPEFITGKKIDGRADVYSATVLLFEMIAGRAPFVADEPEDLLKQHVGKEPPRLADLAPEIEVPEGVEDLLARGLAKDPDDRIDSAGDLALAIDRLLGDAPEEDPDPGPDADPEWEPLESPDPDSEPTTDSTPDPTPDPVVDPVNCAGGAPLRGADGSADPASPAPVLVAAAEVSQLRGLRPLRTAELQQRGPAPASRSLAIMIGVAALAVLLIIVMAFAMRGSPGDSESSSAALDRARSAWSDAGLVSGGFAEVQGAGLGGGECRAGAVSGILVTLCEHPDAGAAKKAYRSAKSAARRSKGAAVVADKLILIVADERRADPTGKRVEKIVEMFRKELGASGGRSTR